MPSEAVTEKNSATGVVPAPAPASPWRIRAVGVLPDFRLSVTFNDGRSGIVDCSSVRSSPNPGIYAPLADAAYFAQVRIELGVLTWPNGADLDSSWVYDQLADQKSWAVPF
jgi:hypothetical protein